MKTIAAVVIEATTGKQVDAIAVDAIREIQDVLCRLSELEGFVDGGVDVT
jgi:hypothetical protein